MSPVLDSIVRFTAAGGVVPALLLKATLLVLLGALVSVALARAGAATRHLTWALTVAGLLVLPALAVWAPLELAVLPAADDTAGVAGPARGAGAASADAGALGPVAPARRSQAARPLPIPRTAPSPVVAIAVVYATGVLACLGFLALGLARARRLGQSARPVEAVPGSRAEWRKEIAALRAEMGIAAEVSVRLSERAAVPLAYGWVRPVVVLPAAAAGWEAAHRRDVLVHELAHVARADWPVQLAARIACALWWFHPLVWWSVRRLTLEAERACDDRVLLAGSDSCDYAERLLRVASGGRAFADPSYAAVAMARRADLSTRIRAILDGRVPRGGLRALPALGLAATLVVPIAAVSTARLARAAEPAGPAGSASRYGSSPLIVAAFEGDLAEVRRLLDAGADPNRAVTAADDSTDIQRSALGSAALSGHRDVVELLVTRGADVDLAPRGDATPLISAARHRHRDVVELLLARGADPNRSLKGDGTALIAAAGAGDAATVRLLLDAGADPDLAVEGDGSPLIQAAGAGDLETVRALLAAGAEPDRGVRGDGGPLIAASAAGHVAIVRELLRAGAEVDLVVPGDENPLIQAAAAGHLAVARELLDAGADPNVRVVIPASRWHPDGEIRTPLSSAREGGHEDLVDLLVSRGARE